MSEFGRRKYVVHLKWGPGCRKPHTSLNPDELNLNPVELVAYTRTDSQSGWVPVALANSIAALTSSVYSEFTELCTQK